MIVLRRSTCKPMIVLRPFLKILKSFKDSLKDKDTSSTQNSSISQSDLASQAVAVVTDLKGNWSLDKLLARADKKNRSVLIEQEKSAIPFVSWLIHGCLPTWHPESV